MTEEQACLRLGVNHSSFRTARHRNLSLDTIKNGKKGWQGRAWILERRHGDQFRRNSWLEFNGQLRAFSLADVLARKPVAQWSSAEFQEFVGAGLLSHRLSAEQREELHNRCRQEWGPMDEWTDEQLKWAAGDALPT
jgi:hypothetical protein